MSLLRKAALINSTAFIGILIGIIQTVILTRTLGPEGIGRYSLILAALMLTTQLFSFGCQTSYLYYSHHDSQNSQKYLINAFWLVILSGLIGGFILSSVIYCNRYFFGSYPFWIYLLIIVYIPIAIQSFVARNELMIHIQAKRLSIMRLATNISHVLIVLLFYAAGVLTVNQAILSFCLMGLVRLIMGGIWARKKMSFKIMPDWKTSKDLLSMGIRQSWADLAVLINGKISLMVIRYVLDDFEQVGYFSRGQRIALLVITAGQAVMPMLFSRWAGILAEKLPEHVERVLRFCFAMVLCITAGLLIFGRWLLLILYGQEFLPALTPMLILLPGTGLYLISRTMMQLLGSRGRPEVTAATLLLSSGLTVVLSFLLTPKWSIAGAAMAELTGNVVLLVLLLIIIKKLFNVRLSKSLLINVNDIHLILKQLLSKKTKVK